MSGSFLDMAVKKPAVKALTVKEQIQGYMDEL